MHPFFAQHRASSAAALLAFLAACNGPAGTNTAFAPAVQLSPASIAKNQLQFTYQTLGDPNGAKPTQILGLSNLGKICGFDGNPNSGFISRPPYLAHEFRKEDYPGALDTEVTAVDNSKSTAGWYLNSSGQTFGFTQWEGIWTTYQDPHTRKSSNQVTEILGIEADGLAVGFYEAGTKIKHPFELDTTTARFQNIAVPGAVNAAATGINDKGDIVGWMSLASGLVEGWMLKGGIFTLFSYPGSLRTAPTSLTFRDEIVGSFDDASGKTHGFILTNPLTSQLWQQVDEPKSHGKTVITGVDNHHAMVGYYKDGSGHIDGFLATQTPP